MSPVLSTAAIPSSSHTEESVAVPDPHWGKPALQKTLQAEARKMSSLLLTSFSGNVATTQNRRTKAKILVGEQQFHPEI